MQIEAPYPEILTGLTHPKEEIERELSLVTGSFRYQNPDADETCDHCKKRGHTKQNCMKSVARSIQDIRGRVGVMTIEL